MKSQEKIKIHHRIHHHVRRVAQKVPRTKKTGFIMLSVLFATAFAATLIHPATLNHRHVAHTASKSVTTTSAKPSKPATAVPKSVGKYGMSVGEQLNILSMADLNAELTDMKNLGITRLRIELAWSSVQPNSGKVYYWSSLDRVIKTATAKGFTVLGLIDQTPAWARPSSCPGGNKCSPANPVIFAGFAAAAAGRYSSNIDEWEIWNEPNNSDFWQPSPSPAAYTQLLQQSYAAIKKVNPHATVVSGSLAPVDTSNGSIPALYYAAAMYNDGAGPSLDAFGFHPYSFPAYASTFETWNAWSQMSQTIPSIRSIMTAHGDAGKQIWATEYGAPTDGPGAIATTSNLAFYAHPDHVSEALQAAMATNMAATAATDPWLGPVFWYSYRDQGTSPSTNENFFGLLRADGSKKPAYTALQAAIAGQ